ncbi:hypothetical protein, partial [Enterobacter intestinihominis]
MIPRESWARTCVYETGTASSHAGSRCGRRSTRKRWSWSDRSDSGRTTDRRCNKPDKTGLSAEICAE